jgi:uncharacterized protein YjbI with pentapeptide repeats
MAGEFYQANLRGVVFKGQDLSGQDFGQADIRGANFAKAILVGANFSHAKAGLSVAWMMGLIAIAVAISLLGGLISGYSAALLSNLWIGDAAGFLFGAIALISLGALLGIALLQGIGGLLATSAEILAACLIAIIAFLPNSQANLAVDAQFTALAVVGSLAGAGNVAVGVAIARLVPLWNPKFLITLIATLGVLLGIVLGTIQELGYAIALPIALASVLTGEVVGWLAVSGNQKYRLIVSLAKTLVAKGGTSFRGANLTDANFTQAILKNTDLRQAILNRTNWFQVQRLEQGRTEGTYLENPKIRQLVVSKLGQDENFDRYDLRKLDLQDANLTNASLIGADFSEANLQNADLSKAKLVQTQLYQTNLLGACLTGAYIQDWAISTDTTLQAVRCKYIFMRLPTVDDPDPWRKPDNREEFFQEGDFADFIAPIIKTLSLYHQQNLDPRQVAGSLKSLDLYHYQGIDPSAAAIALKQLAEQHPEAGLEVVALEGRGDEKIRLQAVVTGEADSSQLSAEYFARYRTASALPSKDLQTLLAGITEKDERIRSLESMVMTAIKSNKFYVETLYQLGDTVAEKSSIDIQTGGGNVGNISGLVAGDVSGVVNLGKISGDVTNTINQLPDSLGTDEPGVKELLLQLQAAIEAESELAPEDKAEALEQVKVFAEAGQKPEDNVLQKAAKTSMKILKGTVASMPDAAKLAESCVKLLPAIAALLALA